MAKYQVLSPINHDGKPYADGEIELDEKVAAPLLGLNVIAAFDGQEPAPETPAAPETQVAPEAPKEPAAKVGKGKKA